MTRKVGNQALFWDNIPSATGGYHHFQILDTIYTPYSSRVLSLNQLAVKTYKEILIEPGRKVYARQKMFPSSSGRVTQSPIEVHAAIVIMDRR